MPKAAVRTTIGASTAAVSSSQEATTLSARFAWSEPSMPSVGISTKLVITTPSTLPIVFQA